MGGGTGRGEADGCGAGRGCGQYFNVWGKISGAPNEVTKAFKAKKPIVKAEVEAAVSGAKYSVRSPSGSHLESWRWRMLSAVLPSRGLPSLHPPSLALPSGWQGGWLVTVMVSVLWWWS